MPATTTDKKHCYNCAVKLRRNSNWKPSDYKHPRYICKLCKAKEHWRWCRKHPIKYKRMVKRSNLARYGETPQSIELRKKKQKNRCALCQRKTLKFHVDHCHKTNKVRGLLCNGCNLLLGLVEKRSLNPNHIKTYLKSK